MALPRRCRPGSTRARVIRSSWKNCTRFRTESLTVQAGVWPWQRALWPFLPRFRALSRPASTGYRRTRNISWQMAAVIGLKCPTIAQARRGH
jgi:hypothetical protein